MGTITVLAVRGPVEQAIFERVLAEHDGARPAAGNGGVACFSAASTAVGAAVALQRGFGPQRSSSLAIGLATVDVRIPEGGNGHADLGEPTALVHAILNRAGPGEILLTEITHRLARPGLTPTVVGTLERPRRWGAPSIARLVWHPLPSIANEPVPPPLALRPVAAMPFVERRSALATLDAAWASAGDGARRLVLVSGEPGAGKTRLAAEFARSVHDRGGIVLWGASSATDEIAFQPFVEALRAVLESIGASRRAELVGALGADLGLLLPRLFAEHTDAAADVDPTTRRYWMFEAVATLVERLASDRPVLLVLDDLHWAGASTTQLAEHVLRADRSGGLCMVATIRNTAEDVSDAARSFLAAAARHDGAERVDLEGLDEEELEELVSSLVGHELDDDLRRLAGGLRSATSGNPFLVGEQWSTLLAERQLSLSGGRWRVDAGADRRAASPVSVREVVGERVRSLGEGCQGFLGLAALSGTTFELETVAHAAGVDLAEAVSVIGLAEAAGLVLEVAPGTYRFRHDLVAQALADAQPAAARRAGHRALAEALLAVAAHRKRSIAAHFVAAVPLVAPAIAAGHACAAAGSVALDGSYDEVAAVLRAALAAVDEPVLRAELLTELARMTMLAGDLTASKQAATEAAAAALDAGDADRLVAAALVFHELIWRTDGRIDPRHGLLDAALKVADDRERARLLAAKSCALTYSGCEPEALAVAEQAIEIARRFSDDALSARVMHAALFSGWLTPEPLRGRLALALEATECSRRAGDAEAVLRNTMKQAFAFTALGEGSRLRVALDDVDRYATRLRQPWLLAAHAAFRSYADLSDGLLDAAEEAAKRFDGWAQRLFDGDAGYGMLMFGIRREQGRLGELRQVAELVARLGGSGWDPGLAALYAELGMLAPASAILDRLVVDGEVRVGSDHLRPVTLSYLADACVATTHPGATAVAEALAPWSGYTVWAPGLVCYGAADRYLGRLAAVLGQRDQARRLLEAALRHDLTAGWTTWIVHSRLALGQFLLHHGTRRDHDSGRAEVEKALAMATEAKLPALVAACSTTLSADRPHAPASAAVLSPREQEVLRLIAAGYTNRDIGQRLHTSRHTVANQVHSILVKTGCANRSEAIAWAARHRLLADTDGAAP